MIDLKIGKLTHEDIGQMQLYVNYYTREMQEDWENPTIGILLCADKNDATVRYTLPENQQQIFATQYKLYLPSEKELLAELGCQQVNITMNMNALRLRHQPSPLCLHIFFGPTYMRTTAIDRWYAMNKEITLNLMP